MASLQFTRITKKPVEFPMTATEADGDPTTITGVDVAILPRRSAPTDDTVWIPAAFDPFDNVASVIVSGPDVAAPSGLVLPDAPASDLWARVVDNPTVDVAPVVTILLAD